MRGIWRQLRSQPCSSAIKPGMDTRVDWGLIVAVVPHLPGGYRRKWIRKREQGERRSHRGSGNYAYVFQCWTGDWLATWSNWSMLQGYLQDGDESPGILLKAIRKNVGLERDWLATVSDKMIQVAGLSPWQRRKSRDIIKSRSEYVGLETNTHCQTNWYKLHGKEINKKRQIHNERNWTRNTAMLIKGDWFATLTRYMLIQVGRQWYGKN